MKTLLFLALTCTSCTMRPTVNTPDGTRLTLGGTFMAETDEVVAELEGPQGYHLRYMSKREDSTRVAVAGINALVSRWLAQIWGNSEDLKTTTDGAVETARINADVTKTGILSTERLEIAKIPPPP